MPQWSYFRLRKKVPNPFQNFCRSLLYMVLLCFARHLETTRLQSQLRSRQFIGPFTFTIRHSIQTHPNRGNCCIVLHDLPLIDRGIYMPNINEPKC